MHEYETFRTKIQKFCLFEQCLRVGGGGPFLALRPRRGKAALAVALGYVAARVPFVAKRPEFALIPSFPLFAIFLKKSLQISMKL